VGEIRELGGVVANGKHDTIAIHHLLITVLQECEVLAGVTTVTLLRKLGCSGKAVVKGG